MTTEPDSPGGAGSPGGADFPGEEDRDRLKDIEAITDAALSRLSARDMLDELIERVRDVLKADTAVVLLLDVPSGELVATVARGLEEEVRQGVRIPVGIGFAGRVAAERRPVILSHVDNSTVINPILVDHGVRSLLGVPLLAAGSLLGVLHVGSLGSRVFSADDARLLQLAADRAAVAVQSLRAVDDRLVVAALQRSLVPAAPPVVAGMRMAARYVTGDGVVGGDWYDIFPLPSGKLAVVVGDVAGSGLPSAVIMGRMRSALRAYALETQGPAEALARLDRKMQYFEPDAMATVLYAILDPDAGEMIVSCAGHLPPVIAAPGQPATAAHVDADPPIGVADGIERSETVLDLPPGALACFYTDGLVERRDQPIDDGIARLCAAIDTGGAQPERACVSVMRALIGAGETSDDVALLVVQRM
jgi:phosphoserine phosphatase RsbU/P